MFVKNLFFLLMLSFFISCSVSREYEKLDLEFNKSKYAEGSVVGVGGEHSELYARFHSKFNKLSELEKEKLALDGSLVSKFYASQYVVLSKSKNIMNIFIDNLKDHRNVEFLNGCIIEEVQVSSQMFLYLIEILNTKKNKNYPIDKLISDNLEWKKTANDKEYKESIDEQLKLLNSIKNWSIKELNNIKNKMISEVLSNKNSSQQILKLIKTKNELQ